MNKKQDNYNDLNNIRLDIFEPQNISPKMTRMFQMHDPSSNTDTSSMSNQMYTRDLDTIESTNESNTEFNEDEESEEQTENNQIETRFNSYIENDSLNSIKLVTTFIIHFKSLCDKL